MLIDTTSILNLPVAVSVDGTEYFPLVQGGTTRRVQTGLLLNAQSPGSTEAANTVFAGPTSGSPSAPVFRALVAADIPATSIHLEVGSTPIASGTTTHVLYDNAGVLGEYATVPPTVGGTGIANNAASTLAISGAFATTLTVTGITGVTLPTTGTLATLAGSEALTNKTYNGLTITSTTGTLTVTNGKTLSVAKSLTLDGTDSTTMTFPTTSATIARTDAGQTFTGASTATSWIVNTFDARGAWTAGATWTLPALTLGGTVSGGGNQLNNVIIGTSTPLAGSFTTVSLSGALTYGGVTLTAAVTGTGKMVLDTSPTIATPIINSAAHVGGTWIADATWTLPTLTLGGTVSGGGQQLNNIIIGTSTPLAGTFTTLVAQGASITSGVQQTTQGSLILANTAVGAFPTTLKSSNSASAAWTLTFPTTAGTNTQVLSTNGSGVTTWIDGAAGGTVSSVAASNGVVSSTGSAITATGTLYAGPLGAGGRLTLASGTPAMTSTQSAKTTIYYTPYLHNLIPIYDGTVVRSYTFSELSIAMAASANWAINTNFDVFLGNDSGTFRMCTVAWSSDTARATALNLSQNGFYSNNASFTARYNATTTFTCPQYQGTYLGTFRTNGSTGTTEFIYGAIAPNGTAGSFLVWNMYNRIIVGSMVGDSTDTWTTSSACRPMNNSTTNRHSFVVGLAEDEVYCSIVHAGSPAAGNYIIAGVGYDITSVVSGASGFHNAAAVVPIFGQYTTTAIGFHFFQALEGSSSGTASFYGDSGVANVQTGLTVRLKM